MNVLLGVVAIGLLLWALVDLTRRAARALARGWRRVEARVRRSWRATVGDWRSRSAVRARQRLASERREAMIPLQAATAYELTRLVADQQRMIAKLQREIETFNLFTGRPS